MTSIVKSLAVILLFSMGSCQQAKENSSREQLLKKIEQSLPVAIKQYQFLGSQLTEDKFPKTYYKDQDKLELSNSGWWCSGFYSGTMLYLQEITGTKVFDTQIQSSLNDLEKEQFNKGTHDLGFMMFNSFGNANRLHPSPKYDTILINSAKSLSTRFVSTAGVIRSWNSAPWNKAEKDEIAVIIDNMMNLELLIYAYEKTGDKQFYDIATTHANSTIDNHYRDDYSSYHVLVYKEVDGMVTKKITNQGFSDDSAWARGQAWGLYGFTAMYKFTSDKNYLKQADHIANFILNHPRLPEDLIPYWDFDADTIPNAYRDSSAAAIIASALLELSSYSDQKERYIDAAETIISNLLSEEYFAKEGENGGFLLKHGVGHHPANSEVDVPLTYGDYYLVEAMLRYKNMN